MKIPQMIPILFVATLAGCQSVQYYAPVPLPQNEIANLKPKSRMTEQTVNLNSSPIMTCLTPQEEKENQCSRIICRENKSTPTGYDCDLYLSKINDVNAKPSTMVKYENTFVQKSVEDAVNSYNKGKKKPLEEMCIKDNVVCYVNAKTFPANRPVSEKDYKKVSFSNSYPLKAKTAETLEISVYETEK